MADAVGGGAVDDVREEAVAVRGHRDEIDIAVVGGANELLGGVAESETAC